MTDQDSEEGPVATSELWGRTEGSGPPTPGVQPRYHSLKWLIKIVRKGLLPHQNCGGQKGLDPIPRGSAPLSFFKMTDQDSEEGPVATSELWGRTEGLDPLPRGSAPLSFFKMTDQDSEEGPVATSELWGRTEGSGPPTPGVQPRYHSLKWLIKIVRKGLLPHQNCGGGQKGLDPLPPGFSPAIIL